VNHLSTSVHHRITTSTLVKTRITRRWWWWCWTNWL